MNKNVKFGLRTKFITIFIFLFFLQGLVVSFFFLVREKSSSQEDLKQRGLALSQNLAYNSEYGVIVGDSDMLMKFLPGLAREADVTYVIIMDMQGKVLAHTQKDQIGKTVTDNPGKNALTALKSTVYEYPSEKGESTYEVISPVYMKSSDNGLSDLKQARQDPLAQLETPVLKNNETTGGNPITGAPVGIVRIGLSLNHLEQKLRTNLVLSLGLSCLIILIGSYLAFVFIKRAVKPLEQMADLATKIADGDFTQTINVNSQDEIGVLSQAFEKMAGSLNGMIKNIREVTYNLGAASEQIKNNNHAVMEGTKLQAASTETSSASVAQMNSAILEIGASVEGLSVSSESTSSSLLEISTSFEEVAKTTVHMVDRVEETSSSISEMNSSINEVARNVESLSFSAGKTVSAVQGINSSVKEVENHSREAATLSEKVTTDAEQSGMIAVEKTIHGMNRIKETVETSMNVINKLGQRSEQIGKILTVIDQVTKQTKLLSLNAAILAAQAGEQGKGFAVVASEIKNLADQTAGSTREISQLINDVQNEVKEAIQAAQSGFNSVENGIQLSLDAREALKKILDSSRLSSASSRDIEKATVEQARQVKQITEAMEQINNMIQQISAATLQQKKGSELILLSTEKIRDSTRGVQKSLQEQSKGSRQITDAMDNINDRVKQISKAIKEQKKGTEIFMGSMENIRNTSQTDLQLVEEMNKAVLVLTEQAEILKKEMDRFKV